MEKWWKDREIDRGKKKEQESAEAISGLKINSLHKRCQKLKVGI